MVSGFTAGLSPICMSYRLHVDKTPSADVAGLWPRLCQSMATSQHHWWSQGNDITSLQGLRAQPWQDCHDKRVPWEHQRAPKTWEGEEEVSGGCVFSVPAVLLASHPSTIFWCLKFPLSHVRLFFFFFFFFFPLPLPLNVGHGGGAESSPN